MNQLSIERINEYAPYKVEVEDGQYIFETDHDILYGVSFDEDSDGSLGSDGSFGSEGSEVEEPLSSNSKLIVLSPRSTLVACYRRNARTARTKLFCSSF